MDFQKKPIGLFCYLIFCTTFLSIILSCRNKDCSIRKDQLIALELDKNYCPLLDTIEKPLNPPSIQRINIFLETSGSMSGYMPKGDSITEFQKTLSDVIERFKNQYPGSLKLFSIYDSKTPFKEIEISAARKDILNGAFPWSGSTYLPSMLDTIGRNYLADNIVNVFISDCIYSPEKRDEKNTELTTTDIRSITQSFAAGFSTSMFALFSEFRSIKYQSAESPYYLFLQGKPENVHQVENTVKESLSGANSQKFETITFGLRYNRPYFSILPYTGNTSNGIANSCGKYSNAFLNISVENWNMLNDSLLFWVAVDLKEFPEFVKNTQYLDSNLIVKMNNGSAQILTILNHVPPELNNDDDAIAKKATHFIKIKVSRLDDCIASLQFRINYSRPNWVTELNENKLENNRNKTFGLEKMILGFEEAYKTNEETSFFSGLILTISK